MTPEQLDHFRRKLLQQRDALNERILAAEAQAQRVLDPIEATDDILERSDLADTALALGTMLTVQHHELEDALLASSSANTACARCAGSRSSSSAWRQCRARACARPTMTERVRFDAKCNVHPHHGAKLAYTCGVGIVLPTRWAPAMTCLQRARSRPGNGGTGARHHLVITFH
jgi:RNA polymerase-binding transcription factor DksA